MATRQDLLDVVPPQRDQMPSVRPDYMDPSDVENSLQPPGHEPFPMPDPMKVMTADASGAVPLPMPSPDRVQNLNNIPTDIVQEGTPAPVDEPPQPVLPPRVQTDPAHIVLADVILGGALPFLQAAADVASGNITAEQFESARVEHSRQIEALRSQHPELIDAAEKAMPFLTGLGIGMAKPAKTVAGTMARGAAAGGAEGAVRGYTRGPAEEPSVSSNRMAQGLGEGAVGAATGAAGAGTPGAVGKIGSALKDRAIGKAAEVAASAASAKKAASVAKGKATKQSNAEAKQKAEGVRIRAEAEAADLDAKAKQFETYRKPPKEASPKASANRAHFEKDPVDVFKQQAELDPSLASFTYNTGMSEVAMLAKLHGKNVPLETPGQMKLYQEMDKVNQSWLAYSKRPPNAAAGSKDRGPGGSVPPASGGSSASAAGKAPTKSTSGNSRATPTAGEASRVIPKRVRREP